MPQTLCPLEKTCCRTGLLLWFRLDPAVRYNILLNHQVLLLKNLNLVRSKSGPQPHAPVNGQTVLLPSLSIYPSHGTTYHLPPKPQEGRLPPLDSRLLLSRVLTLGHLTHWNVSSMSTVTIIHCPKKNDGESTTPLIVSSFLLSFLFFFKPI